MLVDADAGVKPAPIIVYKDAPPRTRESAVQLAEYIRKISGSRPEITDGEPRPVPDRAIWVGVQPAVKALFPQTDFDFSHPEEILLVASGKHVVIAGRDRWDAQRMDVETREGVIKGKQLEYGTANAVYTFLHDRLGVRWLWPGEAGEDVPENRAIRIAPFAYRFHPPIRARSGVFNFSSLGNRGYGRSHEWTKAQRLQLHSLDVSGGHGFGDWWDRFHETNPDFFALQPNGKRDGFPGGKNAKICESNPAVWQQWLKDVQAQIERDPTQTTFNASPNDGWSSGHCVCENCRAWDHPDGEPRLLHWEKLAKTAPALSDRDVTFANTLAQLLEECYPGKGYRVLMMSYGHSRPVPVKARPAENVVISCVANFLGRTHYPDEASTRGSTHRQQFEAWAKIAPRLVWRPNTGSPAGWQQGMPDLSCAQLIEDFKLIAEYGCMGIYIDSTWEHWATQGPQYYLMAQLTWNPGRDGRAVLDDYYRRAFGPAGGAVRRYFDTFEKARMEFVAKEGYAAGALNLWKLYTPALLDTAETHLTDAGKAAGESEVFRKRVDFVRAGLNHTRLLSEISRVMDAHWDRPDPDAMPRVLENWKRLEANARDHPYAINWPPLRPSTQRMTGLHPDHPQKNRGRKKPDPKPPPDDLDQE